jgi:hypothetical protein
MEAECCAGREGAVLGAGADHDIRNPGRAHLVEAVEAELHRFDDVRECRGHVQATAAHTFRRECRNGLRRIHDV